MIENLIIDCNDWCMLKAERDGIQLFPQDLVKSLIDTIEVRNRDVSVIILAASTGNVLVDSEFVTKRITSDISHRILISEVLSPIEQIRKKQIVFYHYSDGQPVLPPLAESHGNSVVLSSDKKLRDAAQQQGCHVLAGFQEGEIGEVEFCRVYRPLPGENFPVRVDLDIDYSILDRVSTAFAKKTILFPLVLERLKQIQQLYPHTEFNLLTSRPKPLANEDHCPDSEFQVRAALSSYDIAINECIYSVKDGKGKIIAARHAARPALNIFIDDREKDRKLAEQHFAGDLSTYLITLEVHRGGDFLVTEVHRLLELIATKKQQNVPSLGIWAPIAPASSGSETKPETKPEASPSAVGNFAV